MNKLKYQPDNLVTHVLNEEPYFLTRLNVNYGYSKIKAKQALVECARYLSLVAHYQQRLTPSITVDNIWHELILFTRLYFTICEQHLGRYIHHHPGGTKDENSRQFTKTLNYYMHHFGELDPDFWGLQDNASACGVCEGQ